MHCCITLNCLLYCAAHSTHAYLKEVDGLSRGLFSLIYEVLQSSSTIALSSLCLLDDLYLSINWSTLVLLSSIALAPSSPKVRFLSVTTSAFRRICTTGMYPQISGKASRGFLFSRSQLSTYIKCTLHCKNEALQEI